MSGCAILFPTPMPWAMPNTLHQDIWYWKALQIERKQDYKIEYLVVVDLKKQRSLGLGDERIFVSNNVRFCSACHISNFPHEGGSIIAVTSPDNKPSILLQMEGLRSCLMPDIISNLNQQQSS